MSEEEVIGKQEIIVNDFTYKDLAAMIFPVANTRAKTLEEFVAMFCVTPKIVNDNFTVWATEVYEKDDVKQRMNFLISKQNADKMHMIMEYKKGKDAAMYILSYLQGRTRFKGVTTDDETLKAQEIASYMCIADDWEAPEVHSDFDVAL